MRSIQYTLMKMADTSVHNINSNFANYICNCVEQEHPVSHNLFLFTKGGDVVDANKRLRELLDKSGWTEYRLSKNCGLSQSTLANIFKRNNIPSIKTLESICDGFGITLAQFFADGDMVELTPELKEIFDR